jgi:hypothetical protein
LTYSERLARKWLTGRRYESTYERGGRAASVAPASEGVAQVAATAASSQASAFASRASRAASEMRQTATAAKQASSSVQQSSSTTTTTKTTEESKSEAKKSSLKQQAVSASTATTSATAFARKSAATAVEKKSQAVTFSAERAAQRKVTDDILYKVADIHISPWETGKELEEASLASMRAKLRIAELERELEAITQRVMTSQVAALNTASKYAAQAMREDAAAVSSSMKKSKKVMIESKAKIVG